MVPMPSTPDRRALELELLALRCQRGERAAWELLVAQFERPLLYYLRRMLRSEDEAWSVLQDTWVRVFTSLETLKDARKLAPWVYGVARRTLATRVAQSARENVAELESESVVDDAAEADDILATAHDIERVHTSLSLLAPAQREVLVLFFLEDLTLEAIAEVLEIPLGTVKSRLHHAKRAIARHLRQLESRHGC